MIIKLFFPNYDVYSRINVKRITKIGYEVVNMITSKEIEDYYDHPTYHFQKRKLLILSVF